MRAHRSRATMATPLPGAAAAAAPARATPDPLGRRSGLASRMIPLSFPDIVAERRLRRDGLAPVRGVTPAQTSAFSEPWPAFPRERFPSFFQSIRRNHA